MEERNGGAKPQLFHGRALILVGVRWLWEADCLSGVQICRKPWRFHKILVCDLVLSISSSILFFGVPYGDDTSPVSSGRLG